MVATHKRIRRQALKLFIAAAAFASFGAVVVAAPMTISSQSVLTGGLDSATTTKLVPLGSGRAIQLAKADQGESEDCVRVTKMTGPDGKVYPTMGLVCGGQ